jgi:hypothetical protein
MRDIECHAAHQLKSVQANGVTFGNYEREFVTEVKNDIEKGVKIATITAVAVPASIAIGTIGGLGLLGYGIYRGLDSFGFGLNPKKWLSRISDRVEAQVEGGFKNKDEGGQTNIFGLPGWGIWPGVW